ncbi:MAG: helix-turn-helix domain-containing protein [Tistlia sp.]|uniref:helix-turn-helix domain-containing protein n=1 Tax=Tistlia sp. TaxID=3057121 RepID=UPI0034A20EFA
MYHRTDVHIGRRIRERRIAKGLSQAALAERLAITFQQVQKYESGANRVGGSRLWELSKALAVPVGYFFEGLDDSPTEAQAGVTPLSRQSLELARAINAVPEGEIKEQVIRLVKAFTRPG